MRNPEWNAELKKEYHINAKLVDSTNEILGALQVEDENAKLGKKLNDRKSKSRELAILHT